MFGFLKRRKHPLPRFPADVVSTFEQLCEALPVERVKELEPEVDLCMKNFEEAASDHPHMNLTLARQIADRCRMLLSKYSEFSESERALVIGAVRYFAIAEDALSETTFASGFHDDARVLNYVLEELGMVEFCLRI